MVGEVPTIKLNNGFEIPAIGFGTGTLKNETGVEAIKCAIDAGYRHIDTAFIYSNEKEVGQAIGEKIAKGVVKREDIFLVTKLWGIHHYNVEYGCQHSLNNLGLDYIDLYLVHEPITYNESNEPDTGNRDLFDIWRDMEKLVDQGLVKSIGVSNCNPKHIDYILKNCRIKPVVNQIENHPGFVQSEIIQFCKEREIYITAYSPLGSHNFEKKQPAFLYDEKVNEIAAKYSKTASQVALRYNIELGTIPIPRSKNKERMMQNIDIFDFKLSAEDMSYLKSLHHPDNRIDLDLFAI